MEDTTIRSGTRSSLLETLYGKDHSDKLAANNKRWESGIIDGDKPRSKVGRYYAKRDLAIKTSIVAAIGLANLAMVGGVMAVIILYCPIPSTALFVSPFVVGMFLAATRLNLPTWGISRYTYTYLTNPTSLIGEGLTYLLFGPYMYAVKHLDLTNYSNTATARFISEEICVASFIHENEKGDKTIKIGEFETFAETYLRRSEKLRKYGFITQDQAENFKIIYDQYKYFRSDLKHEVVSLFTDKTDEIAVSLRDEEESKLPDKKGVQKSCEALWNEVFSAKSTSHLTTEQKYEKVITHLANQFASIQDETANSLPFPRSQMAPPHTMRGRAQRKWKRAKEAVFWNKPAPANNRPTEKKTEKK